MSAARAYYSDAVPLFRLEWVDPSLHDAGLALWLAANRRQLSLVDCVSFATMRRLRLDRGFAFDPDFENQGFTRVP